MIQEQPYHLVARYLLQGTDDAGNVGFRMLGLHVRLLQIVVRCELLRVTTFVGASLNFNELSDIVLT
jgi:hypothetical protein